MAHAFRKRAKRWRSKPKRSLLSEAAQFFQSLAWRLEAVSFRTAHFDEDAMTFEKSIESPRASKPPRPYDGTVCPLFAKSKSIRAGLRHSRARKLKSISTAEVRDRQATELSTEAFATLRSLRQKAN